MAGEDATNSNNASNTMKPITPMAQYQCPKLKTINYTVWEIQIKVTLEAHSLWETIEPKEDTEIDNKKDKATTAFLYQALTEDVILQVASCKTAKELWESLKKRHVGEEKVQQARLQSLMIGFNTLQMKDDDTAKELGKTLDESLLVRKLLDSTPDIFIQIVASIEQTSDLDDITLDEITGKLKAFEERIRLQKGGQVESHDNLLFAQGKHSGKGRRFKRRRRSNFSRGNWQNNRNRNNSQGGNSNHKGNSTRNKGEWDLSKVRCYKCQKLGHLRKDCRATLTTQEQSNLILEDDEPSLLMTTHEEILLNEGQIQPGKYASGDASMWYLDNGASNHMTGVKSHFKDINENISGRVRFGDGSYVQIKGRGSILLGCRNQEQNILSDVYYIPNLKSNIISLGQLTEIGCKVIMDGNKLTLYDKNKKLLMKVERSKNRLYSIILQIEAPICLLANVDNQTWLWHARLGHLNFDDINKMTRKNLVEGIPRINHARQICDACLLGKHSRTPFPNQAKFRSKNPLDLVYGDLCGPISPATHSGKKFLFLLVDDYTRFMWAYFLTSKDQAFSTFKEFRQQIEMELRMRLRMLRTDRGGEFISNEFTKYCKENGIARQLTAPYSPQQNGVVERRNRTVLSTTRSMMKAMKLPLTFWAEAVRHAIYIINRVPTRALIDKTPYEALYNRKPNLENLRIFGCTAYAKITIPHLKKLDDRSIPLIYLGVEEGSKACRLYDSINKNNTWTLTTLPLDQKAIGLKWVYKTKRDAEGKIIKYKARLVAKGYVQEQGIDFDEVFAPFARIETVRTVPDLISQLTVAVKNREAYLMNKVRDSEDKANKSSQDNESHALTNQMLNENLLILQTRYDDIKNSNDEYAKKIKHLNSKIEMMESIGPPPGFKEIVNSKQRSYPKRPKIIEIDDDDDDLKHASLSKRKQEKVSTFLDTFGSISVNVTEEKQNQRWKSQAGMLKEFEKGDELCLNAICAIHRQSIKTMHTFLSAHISRAHGISSIVLLFGINQLAHLLIDGDPQQKMKKKSSELYQSDIDDCRRFAKMYSAHLFEIYKKKDDPFFPPSRMEDK
nr:zinc finger, CCHC-type [Tanacetum cinerariifolium]